MIKYPAHQLSLSKIIEAARHEATGSKTTAYLATTALTGIFFAILSFTILKILQPQNYLLPISLLSFIFAISFSPVRYALEELIRQLFPHTDYNSHELIKNLNRISYSTLSLKQLTNRFTQDLKHDLRVTGVAYLIFPRKGDEIIISSDYPGGLQDFTPTQSQLIKKTLKVHPHALTTWPDSLVNLSLKYKFKLLLPLYINNRLFGILLLSHKNGHRPYTTKDVKVLNAVAPKLAFSLQNALIYQKVDGQNQKLITKLKEANDQLRRVNRQLRHDDKLKDEFVFIATHELKNPVTAVKGYLSLINEGHYGPISKKVKYALSQIESSNQQLIGLLNNLLQIARTEAERLEINTQPTLICPIIDKVTHDLNPLIEQKGLKTTHHCPNPSVAVMADGDRLQEIINNLVSNAVKYSESGTIRIHHEIEQDKLVTHVSDTGVGISAADQKKLFSRFFRAEVEAAKGIPGTGLGLFLVKQLIEKMGGSISFKSKLGVGSTFSIKLPLAHTYPLKTES